MKIMIIVVLGVLLGGCSQQPEPAEQTPVEAKAPSLTQVEVKKLATEFKAEWLKQNPEDTKQETQLAEHSAVREVKPTKTGWHVIFEWVTLLGEPEGESHHFLHVYIDSKGKLEKIERGPDVIA